MIVTTITIVAENDVRSRVFKSHPENVAVAQVFKDMQGILKDYVEQVMDEFEEPIKEVICSVTLTT